METEIETAYIWNCKCGTKNTDYRTHYVMCGGCGESWDDLKDAICEGREAELEKPDAMPALAPLTALHREDIIVLVGILNDFRGVTGEDLEPVCAAAVENICERWGLTWLAVPPTASKKERAKRGKSGRAKQRAKLEIRRRELV